MWNLIAIIYHIMGQVKIIDEVDWFLRPPGHLGPMMCGALVLGSAQQAVSMAFPGDPLELSDTPFRRQATNRFVFGRDIVNKQSPNAWIPWFPKIITITRCWWWMTGPLLCLLQPIPGGLTS